ncbi:alpha/beta hydrolase [Planctomicrobium sp. SH668]|uniref:alpha/beta hydrolase n=1 Tax=Planctomicrobium sp. SH668 TaxID=3448126 RepID=UPI003F5B068A
MFNHINLKRAISAFIALLALCATSADVVAEAPASIKVVRNIEYREGANKGDAYAQSLCRLDIAFPTNQKDFPTIIWLHGGGLTGGAREIPQPFIDAGFGVIGVSYRLSPHVHVDDCVDDAAAAIAWAVRHLSEYGGSPDRIVVSGHSAGGYLVSLAVLDQSRLKKYGVDPNRIAGVAPLSGQAITHFTARKENGIPETQPTIDRLAPIFHVRANAPPILILSGDRELELLGRYEENAYFARMLKIMKNSDVTLIEYPGTDHGSMVSAGFPDCIKFAKRVTNSSSESEVKTQN